MPSFYFICPKCGINLRKLLKKAPKEYLCKCGAVMERGNSSLSNRATELLDNGGMSRPLERLDNAEEIFKDRATKDIREE